MSARCTGHCCQRFMLFFSPGEKAREWADSLYPADQIPPYDDTGNFLRDLSFVLDMIRPLPMSNGYTRWWTCRHWDPESGDCTVYAARPAMCREHPYRGERCAFPGCTLHYDAAIAREWGDLANGAVQ